MGWLNLKEKVGIISFMVAGIGYQKEQHGNKQDKHLSNMVVMVLAVEIFYQESGEIIVKELLQGVSE
eukprot:12882774-Prorocentrum_lima.AAC.1